MNQYWIELNQIGNWKSNRTGTFEIRIESIQGISGDIQAYA